MVDWALLGQVVLVSILAGAGVVIVFSLGIRSLARARDAARARRARVASGALAALAALVLVGALTWGFWLITVKGS